MPIIDNNIKVSIEFKYSDENANGKCIYDISCENINSVSVVKISRSFIDESAFTNYNLETSDDTYSLILSVQMIEDIYNFLISKGLISSKNNMVISTSKPTAKTSSLPLPNVQGISDDAGVLNLENKSVKPTGTQSLAKPVAPVSDEELAEITARRKTLPRDKGKEKVIKRASMSETDEISM